MIKASIGRWDFYEIRSWVLLMKSLEYSKEEANELIQDSHIHLKDWDDLSILTPGQLLKLGLPINNLKNLLRFHKKNKNGVLIDWTYDPIYNTPILIVGTTLYSKIRSATEKWLCRLFPAQYNTDVVENVLTLNMYADKK